MQKEKSAKYLVYLALSSLWPLAEQWMVGHGQLNSSLQALQLLGLDDRESPVAPPVAPKLFVLTAPLNRRPCVWISRI